MQNCCFTGAPLNPPIGQWQWRCSLLPHDGFAIGAQHGAPIFLNASELALLQRLPKFELPRKQNFEIMGPLPVWLKLLNIVDIWIKTHLSRRNNSLALLRNTLK